MQLLNKNILNRNVGLLYGVQKLSAFAVSDILLQYYKRNQIGLPTM